MRSCLLQKFLEGIIPSNATSGLTSPGESLDALSYSFSFFCRNAVSKSIGRGKIMVEFFSVATSVNV